MRQGRVPICRREDVFCPVGQQSHRRLRQVEAQGRHLLRRGPRNHDADRTNHDVESVLHNCSATNEGQADNLLGLVPLAGDANAGWRVRPRFAHLCQSLQPRKLCSHICGSHQHLGSGNRLGVNLELPRQSPVPRVLVIRDGYAMAGAKALVCAFPSHLFLLDHQLNSKRACARGWLPCCAFTRAHQLHASAQRAAHIDGVGVLDDGGSLLAVGLGVALPGGQALLATVAQWIRRDTKSKLKPMSQATLDCEFAQRYIRLAVTSQTTA